MKVEVQCPNGHRYQCDHKHLGRRVSCPKDGCGESFLIAACESDRETEDNPYALDPPSTPSEERTRKLDQLTFETRAMRAGDSSNPSTRYQLRKDSWSVILLTFLLIVSFAVGIAYLPTWLSGLIQSPGTVFWVLSYIVTPICYLIAVFLAFSGIHALFTRGHKSVILDTQLASGDGATTSEAPEKESSSSTDKAKSAPASDQEVLAELYKLLDPQRSWAQNSRVFLLTLLAFFLLGLLRFDLLTITGILIILFIHESGHLLAMRVFGYKELQMFFIPFFGAAASGTKSQTSGWQEVVVTLAGPLPGILIGFLFLLWDVSHPSEWLQSLGFMFVLLNWFNLLPIFPLDGGRVLNELIFCRHRHIETVFQILAGLTLVTFGLLLQSLILGIFGGLMLLGIPQAVQMRRVVHELKQRLPADMYGPLIRLPQGVVLHLIAHSLELTPQLVDAKTLATLVGDIWTRLNIKRTGFLTTIGFLAVYLISLASIIIVPVALILMIWFKVIPEPREGTYSVVIKTIEEENEEWVRQEYPIYDAAMTCDIKNWLNRQYLPSSTDRNDLFERTILHYAARAACPEMIEHLLKFDVEIDASDRYQRTALIESAHYECTECVELLLKAGADISLRDDSGHTALMRAASKGNLTSILLLLEAGADTSISCASGKTAYEHAAEYAADIEPIDEILDLLRQQDSPH